MFRALIKLIMTILKALFKFKDTISEENEAEQQEYLQNHQDHLQEQYNDIEEQHQVDPNLTLQDAADKLNDQF